MAKITVLNIPAHGHINPTLAVCQELVRRGEAVTYFATESFRPAIEATGATFRAFRNAEGLIPIAGGGDSRARMGFMANPGGAGRSFTFGNFATWTLRSHIALIPEVLEQLRADMPEYVIFGNMCHVGRFAAQILEVPAIASFASLFQMSNQMRNMFRPQGTNGPEASFTPPAAEGQTDRLDEYRELQNQLKQRYGIQLPESFRLMQWPAALNIVYTSREFQANAEEYDERFVFVGASIMPRLSPVAFPFEHLADKPIIYISLGTIFNERPDFYRMCIEAFRETPYQVVMVLPASIDRAQVGEIPANFIVEPYVPQLELFPRVTVFITHGGMSSVQEALSFGVPLVVFPQMIEQMGTAQRVAELGAGLVMTNEDVTSDSLRANVERIMGDPTFRENSEKIRVSLKAAGGYERAADTIQDFMRLQNRPPIGGKA